MNVLFSSDNLCPQKRAEIVVSDLQLTDPHKLWAGPRIADPGNDFQMNNAKGKVLE